MEETLGKYKKNLVKFVVLSEQLCRRTPWVKLCKLLYWSTHRPSSEALAKAVLDGVNAAGGICKDYGIVSTPQLHYFVVCENTNGKYGEPTIDGYFKKLATAFKEFRKMVNIT